jgi:hypothetical protein
MLACLLGTAHGGILTGTFQVSNDADSGISTNKVYTHLLDFGSATSTNVVINHVAFSPAGASGNVGPYSWLTNIPVDSAQNTNTGVDPASGLHALLSDFRHNANPGRLELAGLRPGQSYEVRLYYRQWDAPFNRNHLNRFNPGGISSEIAIDADATNAAYYVAYQYTTVPDDQGDGLRMRVDFIRGPGNQGGTYHLYGMTNEEIDGDVLDPRPLQAVLTADNHFALYLGQADGSGLRLVGRDQVGDWQNPELFPLEYQAGEHIYVVAWDNPGAVTDPQMWIGLFETPGIPLGSNTSDWAFVEGPTNSNPGIVLSTNVLSVITELQAQINNGGWQFPLAMATNTAGPWGGRPELVAHFKVSPANFIWSDTLGHASLSNTNESYLIFRSIDAIIPPSNPIPPHLTIHLRDAQSQSIFFQSTSNMYYQIEERASLAAGAWTAKGTSIPGTGQPLELIVTNSLPRAYYRLRAGNP